MFLLPLSPSIIHPHIIAEQFKLWPTTCNLLRGKREREGEWEDCNGRRITLLLR